MTVPAQHKQCWQEHCPGPSLLRQVPGGEGAASGEERCAVGMLWDSAICVPEQCLGYNTVCFTHFSAYHNEVQQWSSPKPRAEVQLNALAKEREQGRARYVR